MNNRQSIKFFIAINLLLAIPITSLLGLEEPQPAKNEGIPDWLVHWELARVLSYDKKYTESLAEYYIVLKQKPELVEVKIEIATILFYEGKNKESLSMLQEIPEKLWNDSGKLLAAQIYSANKEYKLAEPLYQGYLEHNPMDLKVRLKYADLLSWQKRYEESLAEYKKLLAARPKDIQLKRKYAMVLIWSGQQKEGIDILKSTLDKE